MRAIATHATRPFAHRIAARGAAFCLALFALAFTSTAFAQQNGDVEWYVFEAVVDPTGSAIVVGDLWVSEQGETIWQTADKIDAADLEKGVELSYVGVQDPPSGASSNTTTATLSSGTTLNDALVYAPGSSNDTVFHFELEASCTTDCLLTDVDVYSNSGSTLDLSVAPTVSSYTLDYKTSVSLASGDTHDHHVVAQP